MRTTTGRRACAREFGRRQLDLKGLTHTLECAQRGCTGRATRLQRLRGVTGITGVSGV